MFIIVYQQDEPTFMVEESVTLYDKSEYHKVWERDFPMRRGLDEEQFCEYLFEMCNARHPEGYTGHSMSVGDIIEFRDAKEFEKGATKYICKNSGWKKVEWKKPAHFDVEIVTNERVVRFTTNNLAPSYLDYRVGLGNDEKIVSGKIVESLGGTTFDLKPNSYWTFIERAK